MHLIHFKNFRVATFALLLVTVREETCMYFLEVKLFVHKTFLYFLANTTCTGSGLRLSKEPMETIFLRRCSS